MQAAGTLVATRSLKRSALWRIDFKEKGSFRQNFFAVSPLGKFSPKNKGCTRVLEVNLTNFWIYHFQSLKIPCTLRISFF